MDLEKAYDMVNCLRVKGGDSVSGTIVMWDKVVSYSLGFSMCIWTQ